MAYILKSVTLRADNSKEQMQKVDEMWRDIVGGKLALMYDSDGNFLQGLSPVSMYANYESDENGAYDLTVFTAPAAFFAEMDDKAGKGAYKKYDCDGDDIKQAANKAWTRVWEDSKLNAICRAFTEDYESTVPCEYTKDGRAHCYLYIAIK